MTLSIDRGLFCFSLADHGSTETVYIDSGDMISTIVNNKAAHGTGHCLRSRREVHI